jgi:hypothetical protein
LYLPIDLDCVGGGRDAVAQNRIALAAKVMHEATKSDNSRFWELFVLNSFATVCPFFRGGRYAGI